MLEYCCKWTGLTKSEVVRRGVEKVYNELQGKTLEADGGDKYELIIERLDELRALVKKEETPGT